MILPVIGFPYVKTKQHPLRTSDPKNGAFIRGRRHKMTVQSHRIHIPLCKQADKESIFAAHAATKGPAGTTTWTPPGAGSAVTVRFVEKKIPARKLSGIHWDVGPFTLMEEPDG